MATDTFTDTNGVALSSHTASSCTWADLPSPYLVSHFNIQGNLCQATAISTAAGALCTSSTVDCSQIDSAAQSTITSTKFVCVRASALSLGYAFAFSQAVHTNWVWVQIYKNGSTLGSVGTVSISNLVGHTLKITASTSAGVVTLTGYVDGSQVVQTTDSSSIITSGNPGFYVTNGLSTLAYTNFDNWTDVITSISKVGGVSYASIAKINGVAIGSVKKVLGVA